MHSAASRIIAAFMWTGGSGGRRPESLWKNTNQGNLIPPCRNTPAEPAASSTHTAARPDWPAASEIIDLVTKPDVSGKAEMDSAPMMPQTVVNGIDWNRPPSSVHLDLPV